MNKSNLLHLSESSIKLIVIRSITLIYDRSKKKKKKGDGMHGFQMLTKEDW